MNKTRFTLLASLLLLALTLALPAGSSAQGIPSPEEFFGFQMGADRKLAHWDQLLEYYDLLNERSDRIHVVNMGESTLGNTFLSIFISSPENLARLDDYKRMNAILQYTRGYSETEIQNAIENGKVVFVQSYGLHSSEVAASQAIAEITYEFATRNDEEILEIAHRSAFPRVVVREVVGDTDDGSGRFGHHGSIHVRPPGAGDSRRIDVRLTADAREMDELLAHLRAAFLSIGYVHPHTAEAMVRSWHEVFARAGLHRREAAMIRGLWGASPRAFSTSARASSMGTRAQPKRDTVGPSPVIRPRARPSTRAQSSADRAISNSEPAKQEPGSTSATSERDVMSTRFRTRFQ